MFLCIQVVTPVLVRIFIIWVEKNTCCWSKTYVAPYSCFWNLICYIIKLYLAPILHFSCNLLSLFPKFSMQLRKLNIADSLLAQWFSYLSGSFTVGRKFTLKWYYIKTDSSLVVDMKVGENKKTNVRGGMLLDLNLDPWQTELWICYKICSSTHVELNAKVLYPYTITTRVKSYNVFLF